MRSPLEIVMTWGHLEIPWLNESESLVSSHSRKKEEALLRTGERGTFFVQIK